MDQIFKISDDHNSSWDRLFLDLIVPKWYLELNLDGCVFSALMALVAAHNLGKDVILGLFWAFFDDFMPGFFFMWT